MSGKSKHGSLSHPQQHEWRVYVGSDGPHCVPSSSLSRHAEDGSFVFRDSAGIVAEFPAGSIVMRKPAERKDPVRVTLPARFVTNPASVRELQGALETAFGVQVAVSLPGSKAIDAVSDPS